MNQFAFPSENFLQYNSNLEIVIRSASLTHNIQFERVLDALAGQRAIVGLALDLDTVVLW